MNGQWQFADLSYGKAALHLISLRIRRRDTANVVGVERQAHQYRSVIAEQR